MGNKAKTKKKVTRKSANAKSRTISVHLKGAGAKYRALFNSTLDGIVVIDWETGEIVDCNPEFENQTGRKLKQLQKMTIWEVGSDDKAEKARKTFFEIRDDGTAGVAELEFEKPNGEIVNIEFLTKVVTVDGKQYLQSISRDVTKHRRTEEKLLEQNEVLSNMLEALTYPFYVVDANDYSVKMANSASGAGLLCGGSTCYAITHGMDEPCSGPDHVCPLKEAKRSKNPVVVEHVHHDNEGNVRYIEFHGYPILNAEGNVVEMIEFCLDITQRKQAENALRESEERYKQLFEGIEDAVVVQSSQGGFLDCNEVMLKQLGYSREEFLDLEPGDIVRSDLHSMMKDNLKKVWAGETTTVELAHVRKDGRVIPVEVSARTTTYKDELVVLAVIRDITDRKRSEAELRDSEERYRVLTETASAGIGIADENENLIFVNPAFAEMLGYSIDELTGLNLSELTDPDEFKKFQEQTRARMKGGAGRYESRLICRDGTIKNVDISGSALTAADGSYQSTVAVIMDITERKDAEEALRLKDYALASSINAVAMADLDGNLSYVNSSFVQLWSYDNEREVLGRPAVDFWEESEKASEVVQALRERGSWIGELKALRKDGSTFDVQLSASIVRDLAGKPMRLMASFVDITQRKKAGEALRESEERFRAMVETTSDWVWEVDEDAVYTYVSPKVRELLGYEPEELIGTTPFDFMLPEEAERVAAEFHSIVEAQRPFSDLENTCRHRDGRLVVLETSGVPIFDSAGDFRGYRGIDRDITERKKTQEALRQSESMMEQAQNLAHVGSWMWNLKDDSFLMSDELCRIHGINKDEQPGDLQALIDKFVCPEDREYVHKASLEPTKSQSSEQLVCRIIRPDGEVRWISSTGPHISRTDLEGKPEVLVGAIRDITEWKRADEEKEGMEAQLRQSQKMDAIGRLAGGMAHDFNNLLTAIRGYSDLALMKLTRDDQAYEDVNHVRKASIRAANLTEQLLLFSRPHRAVLGPLNLNKAIWDALRMLKRVIGENYPVITNLEPDLRTVNADTGHIQQALVNLVVNAKDAMPNGGEITIKTENVDVSKDYCRTHKYARQGESVRLSVEDVGVGMNEEILSHIFEPFFSTKEQGKGTGLGLSVVYGIVKEHNGWIDVESTPGQGSCFMVYLPSNAERPKEERSEDDSGRAPRGKGEWILVVEDEDRVRELAESVLAENGYVVSVAGNMKEAIRIFIKERKDFALVFSDIVLPDGNGVELAERLVSEKPELRVLLASGYAEEIANWQALEVKGYPFLQKPYAVSELLKVIRELLDRKT